MHSDRLDIYKASAGAGKTYTLAHRYIAMMLENDAWSTAYRHILAVTFTNKATDEMKVRILEYLFKISAGDPEEIANIAKFLDNKGNEPNFAADVQHKCRVILKNILHDYSNFSVTTIDKFFQHIYRSFARELGHFSELRVELDQDAVLGRATDELLAGIDYDDADNPSPLFEAVQDFALALLRLKGKLKYAEEITQFAKLFKKEDFFLKKKEAEWRDPKAVFGRAEECVESFINKVNSQAKSLLKTVKDAGLEPKDFKGGSRSFVVGISRYADGKVDRQPSDTVLRSAHNTGEWFTKTDSQAGGKVARLCAAGFDAGLQEFAKLFGYDPITCEVTQDESNPFYLYNTAREIRKNISVMLIAHDIDEAVSRYLKENGVMLLSDTCHALNSVIDSCDTPFIYEKTGSWLDHYLLDEFQDFSVVQWQNFLPLLRQSLDSGHSNMIVGDVKQSIYRWRGSDWKTLDTGLESDLADEHLEFPPLKTNHRSDEVIVNFNKTFFIWLSKEQGDEKISGIYANCEQKSCKSGAGRVKVRFIDDEDWTQSALASLKGEIESLKNRGFSYSDIAVLVRRNDEADSVAAQLISDGISVITEESLKVGAAVSVRKAVSVLRAVLNPGDLYNNRLLSHLGVDVNKLNTEFKGKPLYEMFEGIAEALDGGIPAGELPYYLAFMDLVLDYVSQNGSDAAGFLKWWEESGAKETISAPKSADAVSVMTIHKAKGLGMPVVILPLFSEKLKPSSHSTNYIWCTDTSHSLDAGLVPVEYSSALERTLFRDEGLDERQYCAVDAINTAYVAFTRPKNELIVYAKTPKETQNGLQQDSVSDKLYKYLSDSGNISEDGLFEAGAPFEYTAPKADSGAAGCNETTSVIRIEGYSSVRPEGNDSDNPRLHLLGRGKNFFDREKMRQRGIVMHDILSAIVTVDDVEAAVESGVNRGEIPADDAAECAAEIRRMVASAASYGWFDADVHVLNEVSIIDASGEVVRPDRVVLRGVPGKETAEVIDYKFGAVNPAYTSQVDRYMHLLSEIGYADVRGYIWYAADGSIVQVLPSVTLP